MIIDKNLIIIIEKESILSAQRYEDKDVLQGIKSIKVRLILVKH